jgi:solute carrier family 13 (sodium-dependent dicarboxylate transporter), member 2/3/5
MHPSSTGRIGQTFFPWRLLSGPLFFGLTLLLPAPEAFTGASWPVMGLAGWMALWWALQAVPLSATALLPLIWVPLLGLPDSGRVLSEYTNSSVMLILGGFLIARAMENWQLHRRIAYRIMGFLGAEPRRLVLGIMVATAAVSMWVSNTSSALMMLPVALAVTTLAMGGESTAPGGTPTGAAQQDGVNFSAALLLGVAYGATIGGLGTLIGTPTNAIVQGFMAKNFNVEVSFLDWLLFGLPTVALLLPLSWWLLVRVALPFNSQALGQSDQALKDAVNSLGAITEAEKRVAMVAGAAAVLWIVRPWLNDWAPLAGLNDTSIAVAAGLMLFLVPSGQQGRLLEAEDIGRIPWSILLLFGGGLALAAAIQQSGLAMVLGQSMQALGGWPLPLLIVAIVTVLVFWTELNSNVATAATFLPILAAVAAASDHSIIALIAPAAMASSAAFMMPVGTPANAMIFGTGRVRFEQMLKAGIWVNVGAIVVISLVGIAIA